MKSKFFSTRGISVLVIVLVFIYSGACSRDDTKITYFKDTIKESKEYQQKKEIVSENKNTDENKIEEDSEYIEKEALIEPKSNPKEVIEDTEKQNVKEKEEKIEITSEIKENDSANHNSEDELNAQEQEAKNEPVGVEETALEEDVVESAKDSVTTKDKATAISLVMKRLSPSEVKRLIDLSSDGFTKEEKVEALELFHDRFTEEEKKWILLKFKEYTGGT